MNGYIIDPMFFYWISVIDNVKSVAIGASFIIGIALAIYAAGIMLEDAEFNLKLLARGSIIFAASILISIFTPTTNTLIRMEIAKHATYENAETVLNYIQDLADHIIEEIK